MLLEKSLVKIAEKHKYEIPTLPDELKFAKTDRERLYLAYIKQILQKVRQDFLTGLEHKEEFQAKEKGEGVYIFIDSDGLKKLNDSLGHAAGTAAILATANGIKQALRQRDHASVSRYGGDEFVVHVEGVPLSAGVAIAKRILEAIHKQNIADFYDGDDAKLKETLGKIPLKASLGVGRTQAEADKAVYQAKDKGRNRVEFFSEGQEKASSLETKLLKIAERLDKEKQARLIRLVAIQKSHNR